MSLPGQVNGAAVQRPLITDRSAKMICSTVLIIAVLHYGVLFGQIVYVFQQVRRGKAEFRAEPELRPPSLEIQPQTQKL
jgi:hypothetical protein